MSEVLSGESDQWKQLSDYVQVLLISSNEYSNSVPFKKKQQRQQLQQQKGLFHFEGFLLKAKIGYVAKYNVK